MSGDAIVFSAIKEKVEGIAEEIVQNKLRAKLYSAGDV